MMELIFFDLSASSRVRKSESHRKSLSIACLPWLYIMFIGTVVLLTKAYAGVVHPQLNVILRFRHQQTEPSSNSPARSRARL